MFNNDDCGRSLILLFWSGMFRDFVRGLFYAFSSKTNRLQQIL